MSATFTPEVEQLVVAYVNAIEKKFGVRLDRVEFQPPQSPTELFRIKVLEGERVA